MTITKPITAYFGTSTDEHPEFVPDANGIIMLSCEPDHAEHRAFDAYGRHDFDGCVPTVFRLEVNCNKVLDFGNLPAYADAAWQKILADVLRYPEDGGAYNELDPNVSWSEITEFGGEKLFAAIRAAGYDAFEVTCPRPSHPNTVKFAVFDPSQIAVDTIFHLRRHAGAVFWHSQTAQDTEQSASKEPDAVPVAVADLTNEALDWAAVQAAKSKVLSGQPKAPQRKDVEHVKLPFTLWEISEHFHNGGLISKPTKHTISPITVSAIMTKDAPASTTVVFTDSNGHGGYASLEQFFLTEADAKTGVSNRLYRLRIGLKDVAPPVFSAALVQKIIDAEPIAVFREDDGSWHAHYFAEQEGATLHQDFVAAFHHDGNKFAPDAAPHSQRGKTLSEAKLRCFVSRHYANTDGAVMTPSHLVDCEESDDLDDAEQQFTTERG